MLFKPERIPPHIGLIANNQFFDLNVKGKNVAAQLNDERLFSATNAFLALKLNLNENSEFLSPFFAKYQSVTDKVSCFAPVKDYFNTVLNEDFKTVQFVYHLIPLLYKNDLVEQVYAFNLNTNTKNSTFQLKEYTHQDIINQINKIKKTQRVAG